MSANQRYFTWQLGRSRTPKCAKPARQPAAAREKTAPGDSFVGGQKWNTRFVAQNEVEADRIHVAQGNRLPHLTDTDRIVLAENSLSAQKAALLKEYWSTGNSSLATATSFRGQHGYSQRTIDDYWAAFYEAERRDLARAE